MKSIFHSLKIFRFKLRSLNMKNETNDLQEVALSSAKL